MQMPPPAGVRVRAAFRENVVNYDMRCPGQLPGKHRINILANDKHSLTYVGFLQSKYVSNTNPDARNGSPAC